MPITGVQYTVILFIFFYIECVVHSNEENKHFAGFQRGIKLKEYSTCIHFSYPNVWKLFV